MADISISEIQEMFVSDEKRCIEEAIKRAKILSKENTVDYVFGKLFKKKENKHLYEQGYIIL